MARTRQESSVPLDTQSRQILIVVGGSEFTVHEQTLRKASAWFDNKLANLNGDTIVCPFADLPVFKYFIKFAYSEILFDRIPRGRPSKTLRFKVPIRFMDLCTAWLLGEELGATAFQDECLRTWSLKRYCEYEEGEMHSAIEEIRCVWPKTGGASKLRKFLIDSYANMDVVQLMNVDQAKWPKDFVIELLKAYARKPTGSAATGEKDYFRTRDLLPFRAELRQVIQIDEVDLATDDEDTIMDSGPLTHRTRRQPQEEATEEDDNLFLSPEPQHLPPAMSPKIRRAPVYQETRRSQAQPYSRRLPTPQWLSPKPQQGLFGRDTPPSSTSVNKQQTFVHATRTNGGWTYGGAASPEIEQHDHNDIWNDIS